MSIRRTTFLVTVDAFKENKSYAFSSHADTYDNYFEAENRLHDVINEWKSIIQSRTSNKEIEFIDKYGWDNIYVSIYEIIPSGECTNLQHVKLFCPDDIYIIRGKMGLNLGYGTNTEVLFHLYKDGTLNLFGNRMKDFDSLEDRPWNNVTQFIKRIELSVERVGNHAFEGCNALTEVVINGQGPEIGDNAFMGCNSLKHFSRMSMLQSIGKRAFYNCVSLVDCIDAYRIDDYAFYNCHSMQVYFERGRKARIIGKHAFEKCNSIYKEGLNLANESVND